MVAPPFGDDFFDAPSCISRFHLDTVFMSSMKAYLFALRCKPAQEQALRCQLMEVAAVLAAADAAPRIQKARPAPPQIGGPRKAGLLIRQAG